MGRLEPRAFCAFIPRQMRAHVKAGTACFLRVYSEADASACEGWNRVLLRVYSEAMRAHVKAGTACILRVYSEADASACEG